MKHNENQNTQDIGESISASTIQFALMVCSSRAMPRISDGLKPVHRRVVFVASNIPPGRLVKSAKIVGDVMGDYHPHGDSAIYQSMVGLAQPFNMWVPLIHGEGNWGSIDGDEAAAMRYTEASISKFGQYFVEDIKFDAVDFQPTYDGQNTEPVELPVSFPNIFVMGSQGIAVGFSNLIPPSHPVDVCRATIYKLMNYETMSDEKLAEMMPPAFPNGGYLTNSADLAIIYKNGGGSITLASEITLNDRGLMIENIPYYSTTNGILTSIRKALDSKNPILPEVTECQIVDEGKIQLYLKRGSDATAVIKRLYKHTTCAVTVGLNYVACDVRGFVEPRYNPMSILEHWIAWRFSTLTRVHRCRYTDYRTKAHVRNGIYKIVATGADKFAHIVATSQTEDEARSRVTAEYQLDKVQLDYVLSMETRQLIKFNLDKLSAQIADYELKAQYHEQRLSDQSLITRDMIEELLNWIDLFKANVPANQTKYVNWGNGDVLTDVVREETLVLFTNMGYIRRIDNPMGKQKRGGRGLQIGKVNDSDVPVKMIHTDTHQVLIFFTSLGRMFVKSVFEIPKANKNTKPLPLDHLIGLRPGEQVVQTIKAPRDWHHREGEYLIMCTANGMIKKTECCEFKNIRTNGIAAITIKSGDRLVAADRIDPSSGYNTIMIALRGLPNEAGAMSIRFSHEDIPVTGRTSLGVGSIRIREGDQVASMIVAPHSDEGLFVMSMSSDGYCKLSMLNDYRVQKRNGHGRILCRKNINTNISNVRLVSLEDAALIISNTQMITVSVDQFKVQGTSTMGVKAMNLRNGEYVVFFTTTPKRDMLDDE